jgi:hypothetical protein
MKYFITLGCSWAWGAGVGYVTGMSSDDFKNVVFNKELADKYSFRNLLAEQYGYKNINFSIHKSSNKKQFRLARNFFSSDVFNKIKNNAEDIIVLWGITSTGRNEVFSSKKNEYINFLLNHSSHFGFSPTEEKMSKFFLENIYDHQHEIFELAHDMAHWNDYFNLLGIKNYWFDSFNHHDYRVNSPGDGKDYTNNTNIRNFAIMHDHARDLMSQLLITSNIDKFDSKYHSSTWLLDTNRADLLVEKGLINPFSFHPTKTGNEKIAVMMQHLFE